jgi:hypothetical protein
VRKGIRLFWLTVSLWARGKSIVIVSFSLSLFFLVGGSPAPDDLRKAHLRSAEEFGCYDFHLYTFVKPVDITRIRPSYFSYSEERYLGFCYDWQEEMSLLGMREVLNLSFLYNKSSRLTTDCGEEERL